jgi:hypothetical protein
MYKLNIFPSITRLSDGASIPANPANTDYAQYRAWCASPCDNCEGRGAIPDTASRGVIQCPACKGMQRNTPEPADIPPAPTYQELRAAAYPPFSDYLDGIVKGSAEQVQEYVDACLAVKERFPKPANGDIA